MIIAFECNGARSAGQPPPEIFVIRFVPLILGNEIDMSVDKEARHGFAVAMGVVEIFAARRLPVEQKY